MASEATWTPPSPSTPSAPTVNPRAENPDSSSDITLHVRLPETHDKNRKAGEEMRSGLQRLGILRDSEHEHFHGSVVFPILNLEGNVLGMYGRKITPNLREGTPLHLFPIQP